MAFPQILGTAKGAINSNSATLNFSLPTGINAGELLVVMVAIDGATTLTTSFANMSPGWNMWTNYNTTNATPTARLFWKRATGSDSPPGITLSASEQCTWVSMRLSVDTLISFEGAGEWLTGSSTNSTFNSAGSALIPAVDYTFVAFRAGDAQVQPTAASSGFTLVDSQVAGTTNGASVYVQRRELNAQTTTPGALTVATEQWATMAVGFYFDPDGYKREIDGLMREVGTTPTTTNAFSFKSNGLNLKRIYVQGFKGSTSGTCYAELYAHSGTFGTSGIPTGSALATTATETITGTNEYGAIELTFATPYQTTNNTDYFISIVTTGGASLSYYPSQTDVTAIGNTATLSGGTWTATAYSSKGLPAYYLFSTVTTGITGDVSEPASATDSATATLTASRSITETATATDSADATENYAVSVSESASASDSQTGSLQYSLSLSESASATDSATGSVSVSEEEPTTATDSATATLTSSRSVTETATATDSTDATETYAVSVSESASASDSQTVSLQYSLSLSESASATDSATGSVSVFEEEAAAATDSATATLTASRSITETATATDSADATENYAVSVSESASASDLVVVTIAGSISEPASSTDSSSATLSASRSITETASASESQLYTGAITASISESATSSDSQSASVVKSATTSESTSATESQSASRIYQLTVSETASALDQYIGQASYVTSVSDQATAESFETVQKIIGVSVFESASSLDTPEILTGFPIIEYAFASDLAVGAKVVTRRFRVFGIHTINDEETSIYGSHVYTDSEAQGIHFTGQSADRTTGTHRLGGGLY